VRGERRGRGGEAGGRQAYLVREEEERGRPAGRRICAEVGGRRQRECRRAADLHAGEEKRGGVGGGRMRRRRGKMRRQERRRGAVLIGKVACRAGR
jgi:hypothetical protein